MAIKSTLTLRLDAKQQASVTSLQALTREATATKAIMTAVRRFPDELHRSHVLEDQLREAQGARDSALDDVARLKKRLNRVRTALEDSPEMPETSLPA